jgi:hypothetical protein
MMNKKNKTTPKNNHMAGIKQLLLTRLGEADAVPAEQVLRMIVLGLKDAEYGLVGLPMERGEFGYDVRAADGADTYTLTVTNCAAVSMEQFYRRPWPHEAVKDIVVTNHGDGGEDRKGVTVDVTMFRVASAGRGHRVWDAPIPEVSAESVMGVVVPAASRGDALTAVSALLAYAKDGWEVKISVAEETATAAETRQKGAPPGFRMDATPLSSMSMSFYTRLSDALGPYDDDGGPNVLRNIVLTPCVFNGTLRQPGLTASLYCQGRRREESRSAPRGALGVRGGIDKTRRRSQSWWESAARTVLGLPKTQE